MNRSLLRTARRMTGLLALMAFFGGLLQAQTDRTWDGGGTTNNWNLAKNWKGDVAPVAGDGVLFGGSKRPMALNNFAAGTTFRKISFIAGAAPFTLSGNAITLTGEISNLSSNLQVINIAMSTTAVRTVNAQTGNLRIGGVISGTGGGITKTGSKKLTLTGVNSYTGITTLNGGTLELGAAGVLPSTKVVLQSGTLSTGLTTGFNETVGTLQLTGNGSIRLGTGAHTLTFAASNAESWTAGRTLLVSGWTGGFDGTAGTQGRIYVGTTSGGLTSGQLDQILILNPSTGQYHRATLLSDGELVALATVDPTFTVYRYAVSNAGWNAATTWSSTSGGSSGASIPDQTNYVFIGESATARTVTVPNGTTASADSLTIGSESFATSNTLTLVNSSSLSVGRSLRIMKAFSGTSTNLVTVNENALNVEGNVTFGGTTTSTSRIARMTIDKGGVVTIGGDLEFEAGVAANNVIQFLDNGTLNLGGAFRINNAGSLNNDKGTVNFNGIIPQTIPIGQSLVTYRDLKINNTSTTGAVMSAANTGTQIVGNITVGDIAAGSLFRTGNFNLTVYDNKKLTIAEGSTMDAGTSVINFNSGADFTLNGTFLTTNPNGFSGATNTALNSTNNPVITLGANSVVDFCTTGNQTVTSRTYPNIKFTRSGTKTAAGALTVTTGTTLEGVTFKSGAITGFSSSMGTLRLQSSSAITLGSGNHTLTFANSSALEADWNGTLVINGWAGTYGAGTTGTAGKIFFGNNASGLTAGQLAKIRFFNGTDYYTAQLLSTGELVPQTLITLISTGTVSGSPFCPGAGGIAVPFTYERLTGGFTVGVTTFTAQLSNAAGSFTSPVNLQSVTCSGTGSQTIIVTIPANTPVGSGYRIRVVADTPAQQGSDNGSNLTVASPVVTATLDEPECYEEGGISLSVTGGSMPYTYDWADLPGTVNPKDRTGLMAGDFSVTVTTAEGCVASSGTLTLNDPVCPGVTVCQSDMASMFATEPDPDIDIYTWTIESMASPGTFYNSAIVSPAGGTGTEPTSTVNWSSVPMGAYTLCVTASNECGESAATCREVYVHVPMAMASADPACAGDALYLFATGGESYSWSGPNGFMSSSPNPVILNADAALHNGVYTVVATDPQGCMASATVTVSLDPMPTVTAVVTNAACGLNSGAIDATTSGGTSPYTWIWSNGANTEDIEDVVSENYTVTVTDALGCRKVAGFAVQDDDGPSVSVITTDVNCQGGMDGTATLTVTGGAGNETFVWASQDGSGFVQGQANQTTLTAGVFEVLVVDALGCQGAAALTIGEPEPLNLDQLHVNVNCFGDATGSINLIVSGGTTPYTYA